jgi:hypothetical protein
MNDFQEKSFVKNTKYLALLRDGVLDISVDKPE